MEHPLTATEQANASKSTDAKKLAELSKEIDKAERRLVQSQTHGETGLGMTENEDHGATPDKTSGAV